MIPVPEPPDWSFSPDALAALPFAAALAQTPQSPKWHAEGDVLIHTGMVLTELADMPAWRALMPRVREELWLACLLHDIGKPACTRTVDGRITSRGHSRKGAVLARGLLWRAGLPVERRERICGLIAQHQLPFFCIDQDDAERRVIATSWTLRCDHLALIAEADIRGRIGPDLGSVLDQIALFSALAEELGCLDRPFPFDSDHARVLFAADPRRHYLAPAHFAPTCTVTVMHGLPGAGKDTWLARHAPALPMVSLDGLRDELGVGPADDQGRVRQLARERVRVHLRAGTDFAFNATNLSAERRRPWLELMRAYGAAIRLVCCEAPPEILRRQNRDRADFVPERVIRRMIARWETPTLLEGHARVIAATGGA